jgi:hypothetical protein
MAAIRDRIKRTRNVEGQPVEVIKRRSSGGKGRGKKNV